MTDLSKQVVIVTGAAGGFGKSFTNAFLAAGAKVAALDVFEEGLVKLSNDHRGVNEQNLKTWKINIANFDNCKMVVDDMADLVRKKHGVDYGLATTGYVEFFDTNTAPKNITLHAWISISSANNTISELVPLNQSRLENISHVSYRLLNLFRKEIL